MKKLDQKGAVPILALIAAAGLLAYLIISNTFSFRDGLFNLLYPKPFSGAVSGPVSGPIPSPTPSPSSKVSSSVKLSPPQGSVTPKASGQLTVDIYYHFAGPNVISDKIVYRGRLKQLVPNRKYHIRLCTSNGTCYSNVTGLNVPAVVSDSKGTAIVNGAYLTINPTIPNPFYPDYRGPYTLIKIVDQGIAPITSSLCTTTACLQANYSVPPRPTPKPTPTPTPKPTSTPSPTSATINVSPTSLLSNGTLTVSWNNIKNPNLKDYINITTADDQHGVTSHTYWINNNCTWFSPSSGTPKASGSCSISLANDQINTAFSGPYHLVLYSGTTPGVTTVIAKSNNFNLIKRVFITSTTYNGNLIRPDFPLTGVSGADDKCNERAYAANLKGNWKAWLSVSPSDYPTSAAARFTKNSGPYRLLNGVTVANNWADLTDGTLQNPINLTELNITPSYMSCVWTSTNVDGAYLPASANVTGCNNYTSANTDYSWCGRNGSSDSNWTKWSTDRCDQKHPLYCFEQ